MTAPQEYNPFDEIEMEPWEKKAAYNNNPEPNPFDKMDVDESWGKTIVRYMAQIPTGVAQAVTYPLDLMLMLGQADIYDDDEIRRLEAIAEREGVEFDLDEYYRAADQASRQFPTISNYEEDFEEATGIPVTAKTTGQKLTRLGASAAKFKGGGIAPRLKAGVTVPAVSAGAQQLGLPEEVADFVGFGVGMPLSGKIPSIGPKTKPSGIPLRRFENVKKPTKVSPSRAAKIDAKLEGDFRKISDKIIAESPVGETAASLEQNTKYKAEIGEQFQKVEELAQKLPETFNTTEIKQKMAKKYLEKEQKGLSPSEYEVTYKKEMQKSMKEMKKKEASASNLVEQYRKNNQELKEFFEPGKSKSFNNAKKDVLLDSNRIIAETINEKYPNSQFAKLFEETNTEWTKINRVEFMNDFVDSMLDGKVDFKKGGKFFDKRTKQQFKSALGEDFAKYEQLMNDFLESGRSRALIKSAESQGIKDFGKTAGLYLLHPKLAKAKFGVKLVKKAHQMLLDKPQLSLKWDKGIKETKAGKFAEAKKTFSELDQELSKQEAFKKAKESGFGN